MRYVGNIYQGVHSGFIDNDFKTNELYTFDIIFGPPFPTGRVL